jgi:cytochrome c556
MFSKRMLAGSFAAACTVAGVLFTAPVSAQFAKTEDAIDYRQSTFTVMSNHMGRLAAMAKGQTPFDAEQAQRSAQLIDTLAQLPWEAFVPNSGDSPAKIKGDPWAQADEFKKLQERMRGETAKLREAAGSLDTLRQQIGATGASCKACHDKFRQL